MKTILIALLTIGLIAAGSTYYPLQVDATLTGDGTVENPLKVDTSRVATAYDLATTAGGSTPVKTISPSQLTGDQDNYSPTGVGNATYLRISGDNGIRAITGITDSVAGILEKTLINIGSYPVYLPMDHPDSDAAHRFTGLPSHFYLFPGCSVKLLYDLTSTKWRIIGEYSLDNKLGLFYEWLPGSTTAGDNNEASASFIGTGSLTATGASTTRPGSVAISNNVATTSGGIIYFPKTAVTFGAFGSSHMFAETYITMPSTLSDGAQTYTTELQITTSTSSTTLEPNNTIAIRYSHGINSGKWELVSQDNTGTEGTPADLGVTVVVSTAYRLRLEIDKSNAEVTAFVNGAYVGRVTSNLTAGSCGVKVIHYKSVGSTNRDAYVHYLNGGAIYP